MEDREEILKIRKSGEKMGKEENKVRERGEENEGKRRKNEEKR